MALKVVSLPAFLSVKVTNFQLRTLLLYDLLKM